MGRESRPLRAWGMRMVSMVGTRYGALDSCNSIVWHALHVLHMGYMLNIEKLSERIC